MHALSILDRVHGVPSAAKSFLVKFGCAISRACEKKVRNRAVFLRITFCQGLVPDAEPLFLRFANVEISNDHPNTFRMTRPAERNATQPFTKVSQDLVGLKEHVDGYQNAITRLCSDNVVAPLAGDLVCDNRMAWQDVLMDKMADSPAFTLSPNLRN